MPDPQAFATEAPPVDYALYGDPALWGGGDQQVAQAPAQPPVVKQPQQPQQPTAPPAGPTSPTTAIRTDVDPLWNAPAQQTETKPWGDADDLGEWKAAQQDAIRNYRDPEKVLSHTHNYDAISKETNPTDNPEYQQYQELVTKIWPTLSKQEQAARAPARRAMEMKINADLKAHNAEVRKRHEEALRASDMKWEDPTQREKNASLIGTDLDTKVRETEAWSKHNDPAIRNRNDFAYKTSPMSTMRRARPDGTYDYTPLRDAATTIAMLNGGVSKEQAINYALAIGSPVGFDDKTHQPLFGYNGRRGLGGASYQVIGADVRGNPVIELEGGTKLRLPQKLLEDFADARRKGYGAAKQWETDRREQEKPGLIGRTINQVRDRFK